MNGKFTVFAAGLVTMFTGSAALAQNWPTQRVTLVVPFAAGGPTDIVARTVASEVEKGWKQPFIIDNRPGAGGLVGTDYVTKQKPDGYTLLFHGSGPFTVRLFVKAPSYDPADLRPVAMLAQSNYMMVAPPTLGPKNLREFVAFAKTKGRELNYGMIPYNQYELDYHVFQRQAGIEMNPIGYQSAAPIVTAVLRNEVQFYFGILGMVGPQVNEGKMTGLAYLGRERHPRYPNVPTAREQGFDYSAGFGFGILAHSKTPEEVFQKLARDLVAALKVPEVVSRLNAAGYDVPAAPLDWGKEIAADLKNYNEVAKALNYQPQ